MCFAFLIWKINRDKKYLAKLKVPVSNLWDISLVPDTRRTTSTCWSTVGTSKYCMEPSPSLLSPAGPAWALPEVLTSYSTASLLWFLLPSYTKINWTPASLASTGSPPHLLYYNNILMRLVLCFNTSYEFV